MALGFGRMSSRVIFKLSVVALLLLLILFIFVNIRKPIDPIEPIQPIKLSTPLTPPMTTPELMMADDYFFRQDDEGWGTDNIGATTDTLTGYGCTISSVAMAASNLLQTKISPGDLNRDLGAVDGYTDRGWLIWKKLEAVTGNKLRTVLYAKPSHASIKQCMQNEGYPIIKIKLNNQLVHWVIVVGKSERGYLVRDPLVGNAQDVPILLSERTDYIYSARCILKNTD